MGENKTKSRSENEWESMSLRNKGEREGARNQFEEILRGYEWYWTLYVYLCMRYIFTMPHTSDFFCWKAHRIQIVTQLDYSHISYLGLADCYWCWCWCWWCYRCRCSFSHSKCQFYVLRIELLIYFAKHSGAQRKNARQAARVRGSL